MGVKIVGQTFISKCMPG